MAPSTFFTVTVTPASIRCSANSNASRHNISSSARDHRKRWQLHQVVRGRQQGGCVDFVVSSIGQVPAVIKTAPFTHGVILFPARFDSGICYEITRWITADDAARLRRHYFFQFQGNSDGKVSSGAFPHECRTVPVPVIVCHMCQKISDHIFPFFKGAWGRDIPGQPCSPHQKQDRFLARLSSAKIQYLGPDIPLQIRHREN